MQQIDETGVAEVFILDDLMALVEQIKNYLLPTASSTSQRGYRPTNYPDAVCAALKNDPHIWRR